MGLCLLPLEQVPGQSAPLLLSEAVEGRGGRGGGLDSAQGHKLRGNLSNMQPAPLQHPEALTVPGGALSLQARSGAAGRRAQSG